MNRQTFYRATVAASLLAAWLTLASAARLAWAFPALPRLNDDATLANAWILGPSLFAINTIILVPFPLSLLHALRRGRRAIRAWDAITLAVGAISIIAGGSSSALVCLGALDDGSRLSQAYPLFFFGLPIFVAGTIATLGSYRMLRVGAGSPDVGEAHL